MKLYDTVVAHLEGANVAFEGDPEQGVIRFVCAAPEGELFLRVLCEEHRFLHIVSRLPVRVPQQRVEVVLQCLNDLNGRVRQGSFTLDREDLDVNFRTSGAIRRGKSGSTQIRELFDDNLGAVRRAFPALLRLLFSNACVEDVVAQVSGKPCLDDFIAQPPNRLNLN